MPEFYMILPENAMQILRNNCPKNICSRFFFWGGGTCPHCPPSPTPMTIMPTLSYLGHGGFAICRRNLVMFFGKVSGGEGVGSVFHLQIVYVAYIWLWGHRLLNSIRALPLNPAGGLTDLRAHKPWLRHGHSWRVHPVLCDACSARRRSRTTLINK